MQVTCNGRGMAVGVVTGALCLMVLCSNLVEGGRVRHCYTCRSRGPLGDCRDPFPYNETTAEDVRGVELTPCASAWCGKLVEGRDDDFDVATERMCLQRPPDDQEERCAETLYRNRRVFMCFCRGDFCNGAFSTLTSKPTTLLGSLLAVHFAMQVISRLLFPDL
ncbi:UPAR/Ly6 domain-containing protein rtv-like [Ornithodoros turicata]|uniref:UPAR/Ly6 domain-containing protein rtv-like n=1 Tax=Ornithodoros turicata TaxID=34597 RepID=UPI003139F8FF